MCDSNPGLLEKTLAFGLRASRFKYWKNFIPVNNFLIWPSCSWYIHAFRYQTIERKEIRRIRTDPQYSSRALAEQIRKREGAIRNIAGSAKREIRISVKFEVHSLLWDTMFLGGSSSSGSDNGTASSNEDRERSSLPRSLRSRKSSVPAASSIAGASSRTSRSSDGAKGRS